MKTKMGLIIILIVGFGCVLTAIGYRMIIEHTDIAIVCLVIVSLIMMGLGMREMNRLLKTKHSDELDRILEQL